VADTARSSLHAATDPLEGTFLKLVWNDSYCSGNRLIDAQHRHLFHLANELLDSMLTGRPTDEISMFVAGLLSEVVQHFYDEEVILAELGYPELQAHQAKHAELVAKALEMGREFRAGTLSVGSLFQYLAHDVVATHMLREDREFFHLTATVS
jgi:hemerythrin-like metal-binding protein